MIIVAKMCYYHEDVNLSNDFDNKEFLSTRSPFYFFFNKTIFIIYCEKIYYLKLATLYSSLLSPQVLLPFAADVDEYDIYTIKNANTLKRVPSPWV